MIARTARIFTNCEAAAHARPREKIIEIVFPDERGCLISLNIRDDGVPEVLVYRQDHGVQVRTASRVRSRKGRCKRREKETEHVP